MARMVVEINFPGLSIADISDRTGFKGNEQDDMNGAINLIAACMSGAQSCDFTVAATNTSVIEDIIPVPEEGSLITELMGAYTTFSGLGASTLTNTGSSVITGDIGVSPGTSITGFPPGTYSGAQHLNDATAIAAHAAVGLACTAIAAKPTTTDLSGQNLGGMTLSAGVYNFATSAQLTGTLTLNGSATDRFVFKMGSTLTTATSAVVTLTGGAIADNVVWLAGSSATIGSSTTMKGNVFAIASITANTSATNVGGRFLARDAAVTLDTNTIG